MNDETHQPRRKVFVIALLGLFIGLLAFSQADQALNQQIGFELVPNNTNVGCGHGHGTCEKLPGILYYNNDSATEVFINYHVDANNALYTVNFSINGTNVINITDTTIQANVYESIPGFIVPKNANWSYGNTSTVHHLEMYIYPILSGRNGTLSINQTIVQGGGGGGISFDGSTVDMNGSTLKNGTFNGTLNITHDINFMNYNVTNISNMSINKAFFGVKVIQIAASPFNFYTNTSNVPVYFSSEDRNNAKIFQDVYTGSATGLQNGGGETVRVARGNTTAGLLNVSGSDRLFQFTGQGYKNGSFRTLFALSADLLDNGNQTNNSSPTSLRFQVTRDGATTSANSFEMNASGSFDLMLPSMGINMRSPDGTYWCVNVTNGGALQTFSGGCRQV